MKFAQQFSRPGKSLENGDSRDKVWKNGFFKATTSALNFFFGFGQILIDLAHTFAKKALFLRFLWSLLITYLITSSVDKENIVLEKSLEKVLNFESTTPSTLL